MGRKLGHTLNLDEVWRSVERLGWSHADFGRALGVSKSTATHLLTGRQRVSTERAQKIATVLETDVGLVILEEPTGEAPLEAIQALHRTILHLDLLSKHAGSFPLRVGHRALRAAGTTKRLLEDLLLDVQGPG